MSTNARKRGSREGERPREPRLILGLVILTVLAIAIASFFWVGRGVPAEPPSIPTTGLDPAAATLIQQHLAAVRADRRSGDAWGKLGALLKSFGFREPSAQCLAEAERLDRKNPRWPYLQATLRGADEPSFAVEKLRRTVKLCGNDPEMPRLRLARLLAETGQPDQARQELERLLKANPNSGPARLSLAQLSEANDATALAKIAATNVYTV